VLTTGGYSRRRQRKQEISGKETVGYIRGVNGACIKGQDGKKIRERVLREEDKSHKIGTCQEHGFEPLREKKIGL